VYYRYKNPKRNSISNSNEMYIIIYEKGLPKTCIALEIFPSKKITHETNYKPHTDNP